MRRLLLPWLQVLTLCCIVVTKGLSAGTRLVPPGLSAIFVTSCDIVLGYLLQVVVFGRVMDGLRIVRATLMMFAVLAGLGSNKAGIANAENAEIQSQDMVEVNEPVSDPFAKLLDGPLPQTTGGRHEDV